MIKEEAVAALESDSSDERLRGARYFSAHSTLADVPFLTRAMQKEKGRWIKRALERAVVRANNGHSQREANIADKEPEQASPDLLRTIRANAIDEVARTVLHEFSPLVGSLGVVAAAEVPDYCGSQTKHFVEQLGALLIAVRNLKQAASTPAYSKFDLSELISECVAVAQFDSEKILIRMAGVQPYMVQADRNSLSLALSNGVRNALEAVTEYSSISPAEVLINWGPAGAENWLAILDSGPGFPGNPLDALKLGSSNKQDHFGYGLTIAQLAMRAMEGDLHISNKDDGGARFELRWYRDYAHTVR